MSALDRPIIEELDADEQPGPFDSQLEQILKESKNDAYKLLSATFEFLKRKTAFFDSDGASKQLARLLKEGKPRPAPAPAQNGHASKPSPPPAVGAPVQNRACHLLWQVKACLKPWAMQTSDSWYRLEPQ